MHSNTRASSGFMAGANRFVQSALFRLERMREATLLMRTMLKLRLLILFVLPLAGCGSGSKPDKLAWNDPEMTAAKAMEVYDKNGDGQLAADELKASPGLAASAKRLDKNRDGKLSTDEVRARVDELYKWVKYNGLDLTVTSKGRPAAGAEVTLTPEPFFGEDFPTYTGKVTESGSCPLVGDGRYLPVPIGFYTLKIVNAGKETVRGVEIATDTTGSRLEIAL
jgi:EF hand